MPEYHINKIDVKKSFSVGDRIKKEILLSNQHGLKTIWFKKGKFAQEKPANQNETSNYTIARLNQI